VKGFVGEELHVVRHGTLATLRKQPVHLGSLKHRIDLFKPSVVLLLDVKRIASIGVAQEEAQQQEERIEGRDEQQSAR